MCCGWEAGGEYGGGHEGGVGGEGCGESLGVRLGWTVFLWVWLGRGGNLLHANTAAVVEEEYVDTHQPTAHGPDGVAGGGFGQRFQNGAEC